MIRQLNQARFTPKTFLFWVVYTMANPVKLPNKSFLWVFGICVLLILFVLAIIILASTGSSIHSSCTIYRGILLVQPIWMFLYYRFYSRLLAKVLDCCSCCEHGICYAIWNYAIWGKHSVVHSLPLYLPLYTQSVS